MSTNQPATIAFAVSSHGFGHAARASAVIEALLDAEPKTRIEVFTAVPPWFFTDWLPKDARLRVHPLSVDVGLVQRDPMRIDLDSSLEVIRDLVDRAPSIVDDLATRLASVGADVVVADIAPLAIAAAQHVTRRVARRVARRTALPSVLIENFTWDDIYPFLDYAERDRPAWLDLADTFAGWSERADVRFQVTPCCRPRAAARTVGVVGRQPRTPARITRAALGIPETARVALLTMGGIPWRGLRARPSIEADESRTPMHWIIASDVPERIQDGRFVLLPHRSSFFHPDLVSAADVVVAKLGYSTLAETAIAGRRLAYLPRPDFPESPHLERWARQQLRVTRLAPDVLVGADTSPAQGDATISRAFATLEDSVLDLLGDDSDSIATSRPSSSAVASAAENAIAAQDDGAHAIAETIFDLIPQR